jgi:CubicO group peptidase (beta-lactamase class C family)
MTTSIFNPFFRFLVAGFAFSAAAQTPSGQHSPPLAEARPLSRTTVETILANQTGDLMGGKNGESIYGLAFGVLTESGAAKGGKGSVGTFQWGGYFNTQYFADPRDKIIGILFKQTAGPTTDRTGDLFKQLVFQAVDD